MPAGVETTISLLQVSVPSFHGLFIKGIKSSFYLETPFSLLSASLFQFEIHVPFFPLINFQFPFSL